jgi:hypothetical protein
VQPVLDTARILLASALLASLPAARAGDAAKYLGRWDVTLSTPGHDYATWLEITQMNGKLAVRMVGRWGHPRWLPQAELTDLGLRFVSGAADEGRKDDMVFEGRLEGRALVGETHGPDGAVWTWRGERAPDLKRTAAPAWGRPVTLFNGKDTQGWHVSDANVKNTWTVEDGTLVSNGNGPELITDDKFNDFKLHVEFNVGKGANSGIYLRGRYEVQVEDDAIPEPPQQGLGGVYGFLAPSKVPPSEAGKWRTYDITLVGRHVTVVLDGATVIDNQEIPGPTGGALDSREGAAGPIYLQGSENGRVAYRNLRIVPARK